MTSVRDLPPQIFDSMTNHLSYKNALSFRASAKIARGTETSLWRKWFSPDGIAIMRDLFKSFPKPTSWNSGKKQIMLENGIVLKRKEAVVAEKHLSLFQDLTVIAHYEEGDDNHEFDLMLVELVVGDQETLKNRRMQVIVFPYVDQYSPFKLSPKTMPINILILKLLDLILQTHPKQSANSETLKVETDIETLTALFRSEEAETTKAIPSVYKSSRRSVNPSNTQTSKQTYRTTMNDLPSPIMEEISKTLSLRNTAVFQASTKTARGAGKMFWRDWMSPLKLQTLLKVLLAPFPQERRLVRYQEEGLKVARDSESMDIRIFQLFRDRTVTITDDLRIVHRHTFVANTDMRFFKLVLTDHKTREEIELMNVFVSNPTSEVKLTLLEGTHVHVNLFMIKFLDALCQEFPSDLVIGKTGGKRTPVEIKTKISSIGRLGHLIDAKRVLGI